MLDIFSSRVGDWTTAHITNRRSFMDGCLWLCSHTLSNHAHQSLLTEHGHNQGRALWTLCSEALRRTRRPSKRVHSFLTFFFVYMNFIVQENRDGQRCLRQPFSCPLFVPDRKRKCVFVTGRVFSSVQRPLIVIKVPFGNKLQLQSGSALHTSGGWSAL